MKSDLSHEPSLKEYRAKRDFKKTREPKPARKRSRVRKLSFVVQKHDASRLHYDFRLEMEGVLKSWAVPKGFPMRRGEKHLAIHVEDHPMDYSHFEGTIPEGSYGGGTVMVWDTGEYEVVDDSPLDGLRKGKLHVQLSGKKLKGEWALVRLKPRPGEKESWLLFKAGEDSKPLGASKEDSSVLTGRSMKRIAQENDAQWVSGAEKKARTTNSKASKPRSPRRPAQKKTPDPVPANAPEGKIAFVTPMMCRLMKDPPRGPGWIYEIKFDGFRVLALKRGDEVELLSRSKKDLTTRFPEIAEAVRSLPFHSGIIDGEVVALDGKGRSSFQLLQAANLPGEKRPPLCYYAFDLVNLGGKNLSGFPLRQRKEILQSLPLGNDGTIRYSASMEGDPQKILSQIRKLQLEGIIAKQLDSLYEAGRRSGAWAKIKIVNEQEFVLGGFTAPKGSRDRFGAVLVGYYEKGQLHFALKVGTGFNRALLESLHRKFEKIRRKTCPFVNLPETKARRYGTGLTASEMKNCTWVQPELVCQIKFTEWTRDGHLRHPVFLGLREDKKAKDVVRED